MKATYLDRLYVLLVVQGHVGRVQVQEVSNLVRDAGADFLITAVAEPHLQKSFLRAQRDRGSDHVWFLELLTYTQMFSQGPLNASNLAKTLTNHGEE